MVLFVLNVENQLELVNVAFQDMESLNYGIIYMTENSKLII